MIKRLGITIHLTIILLVTLLALMFNRTATAHTPQPIACVYVYQLAPPGGKFVAMQRCKQMQRKHLLAHACARPRPLIRSGITVKRVHADYSQRVVLTRALNEGRRHRAPRRHLVALVAAITQESTARNKPYGHGTSIGILQLINSHGSTAWRMVIENSAGWFLRGARKVDHGQSAAALAQDVQRSAYPGAYRQWVRESNHTVEVFLGGCRR